MSCGECLDTDSSMCFSGDNNGICFGNCALDYRYSKELETCQSCTPHGCFSTANNSAAISRDSYCLKTNTCDDCSVECVDLAWKKEKTCDCVANSTFIPNNMACGCNDGYVKCLGFRYCNGCQPGTFGCETCDKYGSMCINKAKTYLTDSDVTDKVTSHVDGFSIHFNVEILEATDTNTPTSCEDVFHKATYDDMGNNLLSDDDQTTCYWQSKKELRVIYGTSQKLGCYIVLNTFALTKKATNSNDTFVCPTDITRRISFSCTPKAVISGPQSITCGNTVKLDADKSASTDGQALVYKWAGTYVDAKATEYSEDNDEIFLTIPDDIDSATVTLQVKVKECSDCCST